MPAHIRFPFGRCLYTEILDNYKRLKPPAKNRLVFWSKANIDYVILQVTGKGQIKVIAVLFVTNFSSTRLFHTRNVTEKTKQDVQIYLTDKFLHQFILSLNFCNSLQGRLHLRGNRLELSKYNYCCHQTRNFTDKKVVFFWKLFINICNCFEAEPDTK